MTVSRTLERQALAIGSIIVIAGIIAASDTLHEQSQGIVVWSEELITRFPVGGKIVFVLLSMISAMVAFFSAVVFAPIAIYAWGTTTTLILLWIGWLAGGVASYCIGRFLGRSFAEKLVSKERIDGWQSQLVGRKRFIQILILVMVVPSEIPGYVLGVLRYEFTYFTAAIALGVGPYTLATVFLGDWFLQGRGIVVVIFGIGALVGGLVYRLHGAAILRGLKALAF